MTEALEHPRTRRVGRFLAIGGLTGFAISQPIFSLLGSQPIFFIAGGVEGWPLLEFALIVALVMPLVLWLAGELVYFVSKGLAAVVHVIMVASLALLALASGLRLAGIESSLVLWVVSSIGALACGILYWRSQAISLWLQYTAALPLAALVLFLGFSRSGELMFAADHATLSSAQGQDMPSVVFVMFDELPTQSLLDKHGAIDSDRFPNFSKLGEKATWFSHYSTVATQTYAAVPSILSGSNPDVYSQPTLRDYPNNIFTLLEPTHNLIAFETITRLCGMPACGDKAGAKSMLELLGDVMDLYLQRFQKQDRTVGFIGEYEEVLVPAAEVDPEGQRDNQELVDSLARLSGSVTEQLAEFVRKLDSGAAPTLYYIHMSFPHAPWKMLPDGSEYRWPGAFSPLYSSSQTLENEYLVSLSEQRHLLQAEWSDRMLGVILAKLKGIDLYHDSLVVVTADHGISFAQSSYGRWYTPATAAGVAYAPLLVKSPGQSEGAVRPQNLMAIDVLPTIADQLDLNVPFDMDGMPASSPEIEQRDDTKYLYDLQMNGHEMKFEGIVEFDGTQGRPDSSKRWTGTAYDRENPVRGLLAVAGVEPFLGRSLDELRSEIAGSAVVLWAKDFAEPNLELPRPGAVIGSLKEDMTGEMILAAIDGTIVTGSPLYTRHGQVSSFAALLPPGALDPEGNDLRLAVVSNGVVTELSHFR